MRVEQPEGTRGSLKWIQRAIERRPDLVSVPSIGPVEWLSPRRNDSFAEYRDTAFLERIGCGTLADELAAFWPKRGPQWDALGRAGNTVILVEAKAHLNEVLSPGSQASASSRAKINAAFAEVKRDLNVIERADWAEVFFQYVNRLAHLWFLRRHGVDVELLFVDFCHDAEMAGPAEPAEWKAVYMAADYVLGLPRRHGLSGHVHHVFPDVRELA